jgi:hypothetical protein
VTLLSTNHETPGMVGAEGFDQFMTQEESSILMGFCLGKTCYQEQEQKSLTNLKGWCQKRK